MGSWKASSSPTSTGNGSVTLTEIVEGAKLLHRTKAKVWAILRYALARLAPHCLVHAQAKTLTRLSIGLVVLLLLQLAGNFGLVWSIIVTNQQTSVTNDNPVMNVKGTNTPVQVASADFFVNSSSGSMMLRSPDAQFGALSNTSTQVLTTSAFSAPTQLSSALPDAAFDQMTHFVVTAPSGSRVRLLVMGTSRIQGTGIFGSVVQILTYAGTITLDGRSITFAESIAPVFADAGFVVSPTRRHLLDAALDIVGFLNYVSGFDLDALEAAASGSQALAAMAHDTSAPAFPSSFLLLAKTYQLCDATLLSMYDAYWCAESGLTETHSDFPGLSFFTVTMDINTSTAGSLSVISYSYDPSVITTALVNGAGFTGVQKAGAWGSVRAVSPGEYVGTDKSALSMVVASGVAPVFAGWATVMGNRARQFTFDLNWTSVSYFDSVTTHAPLRIVVQTPGAADVVTDISSFMAEPGLMQSSFAWPGPTVAAAADSTFAAVPPTGELYPPDRTFLDTADRTFITPTSTPPSIGSQSAAARRLLSVCSTSPIGTAGQGQTGNCMAGFHCTPQPGNGGVCTSNNGRRHLSQANSGHILQGTWSVNCSNAACTSTSATGGGASASFTFSSVFQSPNPTGTAADPCGPMYHDANLYTFPSNSPTAGTANGGVWVGYSNAGLNSATQYWTPNTCKITLASSLYYYPYGDNSHNASYSSWTLAPAAYYYSGGVWYLFMDQSGAYTFNVWRALVVRHWL